MALVRSNISNWPSLSDFFSDEWLGGRMAGNGVPAVNVVDNEDSYEIELAAPGMRKKDFNVTVENGVLTISGKTEKEEEEKSKNYTRKEFSSRSFTKAFTLPDNVEDEKIAAKYEDGVLKLTLRKTEKSLPPKKEVAIE